MPTLRLVKGNQTKQDIPRRGRKSSRSMERRYRYPLEEVWQVSEESWQAAESRYLLPFDDAAGSRRPSRQER